MIIITKTGYSFFNGMQNNTHKCTRNEEGTPMLKSMHTLSLLKARTSLLWIRRMHSVKSPRREVVRSSASAGVVYPPFLGGHSRSIPQGMIFDVQPLVKSLFYRIRQSPNGFLILRPLSPETGYHLWGGGGASKVCVQRDLNEGQVGQSRVDRSAGANGSRPAGNRTADLQFAGRQSNRQPTDPWLAASPIDHCLFRQLLLSPLLVAESATEKTQTVCFCPPACLPD